MEEFIPQQTAPEKVSKTTNSVAFSMGRVLLWLGLGILVTGIVAFTLPDLLIATIGTSNADLLNNVYMGITITAAILMLPAMLLIVFRVFKKTSVISIISYIVFTICVGVLLSGLFLWVLGIESSQAISTIATAFFVTAGCFIVMGLIGALTKKDLNILVPIVITAVLGILVISLVNFFLQNERIYWIVDFVCFGLMLVVTAIDMNNVKKLAEAGSFTSNNGMALYAAYTLYVDFIYLFVRVLIYTMILKNRN